MNDIRHPDNFPPLTTEQIRELAAAMREVFGSELSREAFSDKLLMFLEDVPGYETDAAGTSLIDSAWAEYARRVRDVWPAYLRRCFPCAVSNASISLGATSKVSAKTQML